jgi:hypothetical protein
VAYGPLVLCSSFPVTGLFLLGLAENPHQEQTKLAKKETFNSFLLNTSTKIMFTFMKINS